MARDFFARVLDWERLNFKVITSIPELEEATTIKWYRPSCLSKVSFTIVIKLLANRLGDIADRIIDDCQSVFIKGRNILGGIIIIQGIAHGISGSQK